MSAPKAGLKLGKFTKNGNTFSFEGGALADYQGKGPYTLIDTVGQEVDVLSGWLGKSLTDGPLHEGLWPVVENLTMFRREISQPIFDYSTGIPIFTGSWRVLAYQRAIYKMTLMKGTGLPFIFSAGFKKFAGQSLPFPMSLMLATDQSLRVRDNLRVTIVNPPPKSEYGPDGQLRPAPYRSTGAHPCPQNPNGSQYPHP